MNEKVRKYRNIICICIYLQSLFLFSVRIQLAICIVCNV